MTPGASGSRVPWLGRVPLGARRGGQSAGRVRQSAHAVRACPRSPGDAPHPPIRGSARPPQSRTRCSIPSARVGPGMPGGPHGRLASPPPTAPAWRVTCSSAWPARRSCTRSRPRVAAPCSPSRRARSWSARPRLRRCLPGAICSAAPSAGPSSRVPPQSFVFRLAGRERQADRRRMPQLVGRDRPDALVSKALPHLPWHRTSVSSVSSVSSAPFWFLILTGRFATLDSMIPGSTLIHHLTIMVSSAIPGPEKKAS